MSLAVTIRAHENRKGNSVDTYHHHPVVTPVRLEIALHSLHDTAINVRHN